MSGLNPKPGVVVSLLELADGCLSSQGENAASVQKCLGWLKAVCK